MFLLVGDEGSKEVNGESSYMRSLEGGGKLLKFVIITTWRRAPASSSSYFEDFVDINAMHEESSSRVVYFMYTHHMQVYYKKNSHQALVYSMSPCNCPEA